MNILILNWRDPKNPFAGGAEVVTMQHAKAWIKDGNTVTWFASSFYDALREEVVDGIHIVRQGNFLGVYVLAPFFYFRNRKNFDLVVDEIHGIPFFTPFYVQKPKFAFIHEVAGEIWHAMFPFPISTIGLLLEKLMLFSYKKTPFVTVSASTAKELEAIGIRNVTIIENGIDAKILSPHIHKEKVPTCIFVSRLVKMKGAEDVIDAFSSIVKDIPEAILWIAGSGDPGYQKLLEQKVKDLGLWKNIHFLGRVSEAQKYILMKKAHLLLHASVKEGWGLVVIEAAAQGTPAVTYDVGGLRDSVQDKTTGILTRSNTPQALAKEVIALLKDKKSYKKYQENGKKWSRTFTWERTRKKTTAFIHTLRA